MEVYMGLPTCYVGFSSTDIKYYHMMCAWKKNTNIDFNFRDCQLNDAINSAERTRINFARRVVDNNTLYTGAKPVIAEYITESSKI